MTAKTMAEVLVRHQRRTGIRDMAEHCLCGWKGRNGYTGYLITHIEQELSAAGFGLVADAVVIHVAHDTEAHARSFNEGYEAAVTQGLADDPTLAADWLDAKLRDAKAEALEEAAEAAPSRHDNVCSAEECRDWAEWLRARAAAFRSEG